MQKKMPKKKGERYELHPSDKDSYGSCDRIILQDDRDDDEEESGDEGEESPGLQMPPVPKCDTDTYFRDGKRKIDYVLVYEERPEAHAQKAYKHEGWRKNFMANLAKAGLHMEEEAVESGGGVIHFIKLHAPWPVLVHHAELLCMRAPLQAHPNPSHNWSEGVLRALRLPNPMLEEVPNKPLDYYTCAFKKNKLDKFVGSESEGEFFGSTQRIRIAHSILQSAAFGKRRRAQIGIDRLLEMGVYAAAFPLHDGPYQLPNRPVAAENLNRRQILYQYWARWGKWYKYQPLDHVREYFGEKIGMYFAWLGFYTGWLFPAAVVGLGVFLYGVSTMHYDMPSREVCNSGAQFMMCPRCEGCPYWLLNETCLFSRLAYLFDHPGTVFYAVFVSFWAVTFLEYWKRKSASLAHHWDCMDFEEEEERPRPEFAAKAQCVERNPITGIKEPSFPQPVRVRRMALGAGAILVMLSLVVIFLVAVVLYRVLVSAWLSSSGSLVATSTGALLNLLLIMALGRVYEKLALRLTQWEMHRTQTDFDNHLTFKVFVFQFINFYSSIFYIAFFKGRFVGYPGHYNKMLGLRNEECGTSGCLMELAQQLAIIMIGKQIINNAQEILVPKVKSWFHRKRTRMDGGGAATRWEQDYQLIEHEGLFQEYLEMVLQFGFSTLFVAAFPLAPLFALLNNWAEVRLDAQKLVRDTRRAVAERAQSLGVWLRALELIAHLAVVSNAFLIAFTSEFLPKLLYEYEFRSDLSGYVNFTLAWAPDNTLAKPCRYPDLRDREGNLTNFYWRLLALRLGFVIIFEHVVLSVCRLIDLLVPDIPEALELKIKRERYLAKQALADSNAIMKMAQRRDGDEDEEAH